MPQLLRADNCPEFRGEALTGWAREAGLVIRYIHPGKPSQNTYIKLFSRTLCKELMDQYLFVSLEGVREAAH